MNGGLFNKYQNRTPSFFLQRVSPSTLYSLNPSQAELHLHSNAVQLFLREDPSAGPEELYINDSSAIIISSPAASHLEPCTGGKETYRRNCPGKRKHTHTCSHDPPTPPLDQSPRSHRSKQRRRSH